MRSKSANRSLVLAFVFVCGPVLAAGVQKWTDAQGNVHYGDAPPPGASIESVRVNAPPPSRNPAPVYSQPPATAQQPSPSRSFADERQAQVDEANKRNREGMAAMAAAQARTQALNDKALVDQCKTQRNSYCNQGVNTIRQKNYEHEQMQAANQQSAAMQQGRVIPPGQRIQPTAPCQWPQTCTDKKK